MPKLKIQVNESRIISDLNAIINTSKPRNSVNVDILDEVADYIKGEFEKTSDKVEFQEFEVDGNIYKNVICSFGPENAARIIVGAHYDVNEDTDGADDNASAVVGLLEIARNLKDRKLKIVLIWWLIHWKNHLISTQKTWAVMFMHSRCLITKWTLLE